MTKTWQTLSNDKTVILLQNTTGKYSIFDTKHGKSVSFFICKIKKLRQNKTGKYGIFDTKYDKVIQYIRYLSYGKLISFFTSKKKFRIFKNKTKN